ncbi:tryptophan synthase subunit alpha [Brevundimonas sp. 2R-24]|uniref:Tryptophan synthase alpha chain n=1 Tax=Peiella sedimenti TaxID=3061083 RepID=A0ABT8SLV3_9CAUL|nr:tryptophan synthase subunit alpha [Caulobacteraceae bacterium XZ-24]
MSGPFERNPDRACLVAYIMAGDPDLETTYQLMTTGLAGADIIELGMPFSDPMAEGPSIQRAAQRALKAGTTLKAVLGLVRRFRETDTVTPVVLMGYLNPVESYGYEAFARDAADAGADAAIIVDCPPEEANALADALEAARLSLIPLATPTTDARRLPMVLKRASGFIYYVSVAGVTGVKSADAGSVAEAVARIKAASRLPVAAGFGVRTPERAAEMARIADAVVVGSAIVNEVAAALDEGVSPVERVETAVWRLAEAVRNARLA